MRLRGRTDSNQREIVDALRQAGCSVCILSNLGNGVPDLLVGAKRRNVLMEIKAGGADLTEDERTFHRSWRGRPVVTVRTKDEALATAGMVRALMQSPAPLRHCENESSVQNETEPW